VLSYRSNTGFRERREPPISGSGELDVPVSFAEITEGIFVPDGDNTDDGGLRPEDKHNISRKLENEDFLQKHREGYFTFNPPDEEGELEDWIGGTPQDKPVEPETPEPDASDPSQLEEGQMIVSGPDGDKVVDVERLDGKPASTRKWGRDWLKRAVWTTVTVGATVLTIITVLPESDTASTPVTTATTAQTTTSTTKTATTTAQVEVSEFSVTDGRGDLVAAFPGDFEPISEPNNAGDVIRLALITDPGGNTTSIGIIFAGSAQDLQSLPGQALSADILITPVGGNPILNLILKTDGTGKGSGLPSGMSASGGFLPGGTEFWFLVTGYVVEPGSTVSVRTIQEDQGAISSDTATLEVGKP
jgi:hypothetical protein